MKRDRQIEILNRLVDLRNRRQFRIVNDEVVHRPLDIYTSQEIFDREIETLFLNFPLVAGHIDRVREPGQYMLNDWKRQPYIVVRDDNGVLRAFWNTCRHRGATLVKSETDTPLQSLVCPFHGWTYGLDGTLRHIPRSFAFPCIDKKDHGLKELSVTESMGLVWVCPKGHSSLDPVGCPGTFADDIGNFRLDRYVRYRKVAVEKKANWKLLMHVNLETYHIPTLHRYTFAKGFRNGVLTYDADGPNLRVCVGRINLMDSMSIPEEERDILDYVTLFYVMFPNTILIVRAEYISIHRFLPLAPDRTIWTHELLYPSDRFTGESGGKSLRNLFSYVNDVVLDSEDYAMAETIQENLLNGVNEAHMLGLEEGLIVVFQDIVNNRMGSVG